MTPRTLFGILAVVVAAAPASQQKPDAPAFEIASIKLADPELRLRRTELRRLHVIGVAAKRRVAPVRVAGIRARCAPCMGFLVLSTSSTQRRMRALFASVDMKSYSPFMDTDTCLRLARCQPECQVKGRQEKTFSRVDNTGIDSSLWKRQVL